MKITESINETIYKGLVPVIPFFPFSMKNRLESFDFLKNFYNTYFPTAMGFIYPGKTTIGPWKDGSKWGKGYEWELFQYIYAFKHQTGAPIVLAINYKDIVDFGIFPYAQEGHKIGLDTILVNEPIPEEIEYFAAEMTNGGVGIAFVIDDIAWEDSSILYGFSTSFVYLSQPISEKHKNELAKRHIFYKAQFTGLDSGGDNFTGWIIDDVLGGVNWNPPWQNIDSEQVWSVIRKWMETGK